MNSLLFPSRGLHAVFPKIMTRSMFCPTCAKNKMPSVGNLAVFYGTRRGYCFVETIKEDNDIKEYGFTPHIIREPKIIFLNDVQTVTFDKVCAINGCGIDLRFNAVSQIYDIAYQEIQDGFLSIEHFLALINFKDKNYYVNPY